MSVSLHTDLASTPAGKRSWTFGIGLAAALVAATLAAIPYSALPGPKIPAFIPAVYSASILAYALTGFLFINQYAITRRPSLIVLALAYIFAAAMTLPYLLSYPEVFGPHGLLGGRSDASGWLWLFEHVGFVALLLGYVLTEWLTDGKKISVARSTTFCVVIGALTGATTLLLIWTALANPYLFPISVNGKLSPSYGDIIIPAALNFTIGATLLMTLALPRLRTSVPLWAAVIALAVSLEILVSVAGGGRYTFGWYFGRLEVAVSAGLLLCAFLYYINRVLLAQARTMRLLSTARDDAELAAAEKEELLHQYRREYRVASSFQNAALPVALPVIPGLTFSGFYQPGKSEARVGGDWYDALRLRDGRIVISIGDVSGSGLDAAVIMANIRQVVRGIALVHTDPVMILDAADQLLRAEHSERFVTAFVGIFDPILDTFTYASAGHNRPLVRDKEGGLQELCADGLPLGLRIRGDAEQKTVALEPGTLLVLYTDGLVESTYDNAEGERMLEDAIRALDVEEPTRLAETIYRAVLTDGSRDDVAILTVLVGQKNASPQWHWSLNTGNAERVGAVREQIRALLESRGVERDDSFSAELIFNELLGNVVRYAPGPLDVYFDWTGAAPVLHLLDSGSGFSRLPSLPHNIFSESGRGLYIVNLLSEDFHVTKREGGGSHARAVLSIRGARRSYKLQETYA